MRAQKKKIFILDTNVILHDSSCIYRFQENDIVIPISVLEELDQFKKGNDSVNYHAREFLRVIDSLSGDKLFNTGVKIREDLGCMSVKLEDDFHPEMQKNFSNTKVDHKILNTAFIMTEKSKKTPVILVSKDVNLRLKAKSLGILSQDYRNDTVKDISTLYTGSRLIEYAPENLIGQLYTDPFEFHSELLELEDPLKSNEYLILKSGKMSALGVFDPQTKMVKHIDKVPAFGITAKNAEQIFALNALLNDNIKLVSLIGKAGTGKTLLALAAALERRKAYRQILMARPVVPLSNKDLGFLPGDVHSKLEPYMQPLFDNLGVLKMLSDNQKEQIDKFMSDDKLVIAPLAYIRGRSLVKLYFIVDEAQNLTPHEVKTIITRAGEGTKIILTGDIFQIDHPYLDTSSNGLSYLIEKMQGLPLYAHVTLSKGERSELADLASTLL